MMERRFHPSLVNPPGTGEELRADCIDWDPSLTTGETRLSTTASIEEVLTHYGAQLADSGWAIAMPDEVMSRTWTRRDRVGITVEVTLTALRTPRTPRCVEVRMEATVRPPG